MTVQELINELQKYHPNLPVWIETDDDTTQVIKVEQDFNSILIKGDI